MSNLTTLLEIADMNAFSNLFEVTVGSSEVVQKTFKIRMESVNLDGLDLEFTVNESTKQHQLVKASKAKNISMRVRESNDFYFYKYMNSWFKDFYSPENNYYMVGSTDNSVTADIVKRRTITMKFMGNRDTDYPYMTITCNNAMPKKVPSLAFSYTSSTPLIYDLSFVADNIVVTDEG